MPLQPVDSYNPSLLMPHLSYHPPTSAIHTMPSIPSSTSSHLHYAHSSASSIPRERPPVSKVNTTKQPENLAPPAEKRRNNSEEYLPAWLPECSTRVSPIPAPSMKTGFPDYDSVPSLYGYNALKPVVPIQANDVSVTPSTSQHLTSLNNMTSMGNTSGVDLVAALGSSMFVPSLSSYAPLTGFSEMPALRDAINGLSCLSY